MTEGEPEIGNGETNLVLRQIATNHDRWDFSHSFRQSSWIQNAYIFIEICSLNYRIQGHF